MVRQIFQSISSVPKVWLSGILLAICCGIWGIANYRPDTITTILPQWIDHRMVLRLSYIALFASIYSTIATLINTALRELKRHYRSHAVAKRLVSLRRLLTTALFLVILNQLLSNLTLSPGLDRLSHHLLRIFGIATLAWCLLELIRLGEALLLESIPFDVKGSIGSRQRYTYLVIVRRLLMLLLVIVTVAIILMGFERIRVAGTAILASAGLFATIIGFSARGLLESIFKGIQLIIAQPIRLLDTVAIHGEVGTVTSITLHHAVITLDDQSQLIVPTGDFLDKAFKNWTHSSNHLTGHILFYSKYTLSPDLIRKEFHAVLKASQYWDQAVGEAKVNHITPDIIELKLTMSARTAAELSTLRHETLEKLLAYMQTHHPDSLP